MIYKRNHQHHGTMVHKYIDFDMDYSSGKYVLYIKVQNVKSV